MIVYMYAFKLLFQKILFQKKNSDDSCCSVSCLDDSAIFPFFFQIAGRREKLFASVLYFQPSSANALI
jgi:hypothetical protein